MSLPQIALTNPEIWPERKAADPDAPERPLEFVSVEVRWNYKHTDRESMGFCWAAKKMGFGEISFGRNSHAESTPWGCDSECMSEEFVVAALKFYLKTAPKQRKAKNRRWNKRRNDPRQMAQYVIDHISEFGINAYLDDLYESRGWN